MGQQTFSTPTRRDEAASFHKEARTAIKKPLQPHQFSISERALLPGRSRDGRERLGVVERKAKGSGRQPQ